MLVVFNVLEYQLRVVVGSCLCIVLALYLDSAHCNVIDSNLTVECFVFHASSYGFVKVQLLEFVGSEEIVDFGMGFDSRSQ